MTHDPTPGLLLTGMCLGAAILFTAFAAGAFQWRRPVVVARSRLTDAEMRVRFPATWERMRGVRR